MRIFQGAQGAQGIRDRRRRRTVVVRPVYPLLHDRVTEQHLHLSLLVPTYAHTSLGVGYQGRVDDLIWVLDRVVGSSEYLKHCILFQKNISVPTLNPITHCLRKCQETPTETEMSPLRRCVEFTALPLCRPCRIALLRRGYSSSIIVL